MAAVEGEKSRLLTMPLEILQQIVRHLTTPEYAQLRLTCKHLEASVFNAFSKEFFRKKQFMLTLFSLQALVDISKSRLADGLKHIIINVERPSRHLMPAHLPNVRATADVRRRTNSYRETYIDHLALIESGHDIDMMAQAFANLKNLETVELRDFDSESRYRDNTSWRSYGKTTYIQETGAQLEIPGDHGRFSNAMDGGNDWASRLFQNMLRALGRTSIRPTRFEVNLRRSGLDDKAFKIQKYDESSIVSVLAKLETFYMDLSSNFIFAQVASQDQDNGATQCFSYYLRKFLRHIDKIQHLRLNFKRFTGSEVQDFLSWLSKTPQTSSLNTDAQNPDVLPDAPPSVLFRNLQRLEIGKLAVESNTLLALLRKHKATLRAVQFHLVSIVDNSSYHSRVNHWSKFFGHMAKAGLDLNHITMSLLSQEKFTVYKRHVSFKDCPRGPRVWEGQDLPGALKDLMDTVTVDWPTEDTDSGRVESDEDSDDDSLGDLIDDEIEELNAYE
ncbi:hypothetical protein BKA67DRAFT_641401 [Truncatella angustata]|uniref:F-box domain-containing protein n=1 Tax=Truncatella angustata TaxID=152316 RepID=A0A9P8UXZ3_9PEZI|nr:uncharacterized protein BKA67DRAFT_641401 [Truncatella angustata]KAH6660277.1 hypothetical protein BKA67DRAFT_641401 [Truncatella angustata]KAH8202671.1 hypothetical protein TruAng_003157 [Truncatella angustata]